MGSLENSFGGDGRNHKQLMQCYVVGARSLLARKFLSVAIRAASSLAGWHATGNPCFSIPRLQLLSTSGCESGSRRRDDDVRWRFLRTANPCEVDVKHENHPFLRIKWKRARPAQARACWTPDTWRYAKAHKSLQHKAVHATRPSPSFTDPTKGRDMGRLHL